jgi:hypothetical protein
MNIGSVIFAQNNNTIDYVKLAIFSANKIKQHLSIPVSLITDSKDWVQKMYPDNPFDQIIEIPVDIAIQKKYFHDGTLSSQRLDWKNQTRSSVYNLTPYDRTLVIDSDYLINSNVLVPALDNEYDFQIYRNSFDLAGWRNTSEFKRINQYSIPFYWATVFIFNKNSITESFFNLVSYIKTNWLYFRNLYSIENNIFRNDFAFSIAIHIMNEKSAGGFAIDLPGTMSYITDKDFLIKIDDNKLHFLLEKQNHPGEYIASKTSGIDMHVMNKLSLSRYIDGGLGV